MQVISFQTSSKPTILTSPDCDFTLKNCENWGQVFRVNVDTQEFLPLSRLYKQAHFEKVRHADKEFFDRLTASYPTMEENAN
jgi:hypothetical protein